MRERPIVPILNQITFVLVTDTKMSQKIMCYNLLQVVGPYMFTVTFELTCFAWPQEMYTIERHPEEAREDSYSP